VMRGPTNNRFWEEQKHFFHRDFRKYVDELIAKSGVCIGSIPGDFADRL